MSAISQDAKLYLATIGRIGGMAGRGESKRRSPSHYAKLANDKRQAAMQRRAAKDRQP